MFIAKNNDLIILANNNKKELENQLKFMVYTDIEETDIQYTLYNGQYLTPEEVEQKEIERRNSEIDSKISELQQMAVPELLNGNKSNVDLYLDVINGLEQARPI